MDSCSCSAHLHLIFVAPFLFDWVYRLLVLSWIQSPGSTITSWIRTCHSCHCGTKNGKGLNFNFFLWVNSEKLWLKLETGYLNVLADGRGTWMQHRISLTLELLLHCQHQINRTKQSLTKYRCNRIAHLICVDPIPANWHRDAHPLPVPEQADGGAAYDEWAAC